MIRVIAHATCREALRSRSFLGLLGLYLVFVLMARVVGWISATDGNLVTTDVVFSLQSIVGVLVAIATGTALMQVEIQQRTLYTVLGRPVSRTRFVLGKFLGLAAALVIGQVAMLAMGLAYLALTGAPVSWALVVAGLFTAEEVVVMAAAALAWTTLSTPLLAAALGLATYGLGHAVHELPGFVGYVRADWARQAIIVVASVIPDLGQFGYRNRAVHGQPITSAEYLAIPYGLAWICLLVTVTVAVFRRRQL